MNDKKQDQLRITDQFRTKRGMAYDLKCFGSRITVFVNQRESDDDPENWQVEASSSQNPNVPPISAWAPTRAEALREVGVQWAAAVATQGLAEFDWAAIAQVLSVVRAI